VVICDTRLPDGDWKAVLDALSGTPAAPNRIVISQWPDDDAIWAEVLNLGGRDVLAKPFVPEEVIWATRSAWLNWRNKRQVRPPAKVQNDRTRSAAAGGSVGGSAA
jgi:DNA-binding response OmpR family regulator